MKYIVKISFYKFEFDDPNKAVAFAEEAKSHYTDEKGEDIDVEIVLRNKEVK